LHYSDFTNKLAGHQLNSGSVFIATFFILFSLISFLLLSFLLGFLVLFLLLGFLHLSDLLLLFLLVFLLLLLLGTERRPGLVLVGPSKIRLRTVGVKPVLDLLLSVELLVVGEDAEVVGEESASNGGNPEGEDDLLLRGDGDVTDSIVTGGNLVALVQEGEVGGVPAGKQGNDADLGWSHEDETWPPLRAKEQKKKDDEEAEKKEIAQMKKKKKKEEWEKAEAERAKKAEEDEQNKANEGGDEN
jgi:hypothetical protein